MKKKKDKPLLRDVIDTFIEQMEDINDKRVDAAHKEMQYCMTESRLFNELRQNLYTLDRDELLEIINHGISQDQFPMEEGGLVLHGPGEEGQSETGTPPIIHNR